MVCEQITPGPQQGVALFAVDECFNPIYGIDMGYFDNCATVGELDIQTAETRAEFLKTCPNGDIRAYKPPRTVTKYTGVTFNFAWLPIEFLASVGASNPILFNGEVVGYTDCDNLVNLIAVVYQELLGSDSCGGGTPGAQSVATIYALSDVRISEDGDKGSSDFSYQLIGNSVRKNIGSGPLPLFFDEGDPETPAYPDACIETCAKGAVFKAWGPPAECGLITTVEPDEPCTTGS